MDKKTMDQMIKMNDMILDLRTIVPQLEAKLSSLESENNELREMVKDLELKDRGQDIMIKTMNDNLKLMAEWITELNQRTEAMGKAIILMAEKMEMSPETMYVIVKAVE